MEKAKKRLILPNEVHNAPVNVSSEKGEPQSPKVALHI
jgi:hypothetical protein